MDQAFADALTTLGQVGLGMATNALYDLATLSKKRRAEQPEPLTTAVERATKYHPNPTGARDGLLAWFRSDGFQTVISEIRTDPQKVNSLYLAQLFDKAKDFENPIQGTAHVEAVVRNFFVEYRNALLRSSEGAVVLSEQLERTQQAIREEIRQQTEPIYEDTQNIRRILGTKTFLNLSEFSRLLEIRSAFGYAVPFVRTGWLTGTTDVQKTITDFLASDERVALLTAPGGFGKTRLALEIGLWVGAALGWEVCFVHPEVRQYPGHLGELPSGRTLVLVDDAESAHMDALLHQLALEHPDWKSVRLLGFARTTFEGQLERELSRFSAVARLRATLGKLSFEEAVVLLEHFGVTAAEPKEQLYALSEGVPFFLIAALERIRRRENPYELASKEVVLTRYIEEALDGLEHEGCPRDLAKRSLARLAVFRRVGEGDERSMELLAELVGSDVASVEEVLREATKLSLLRESRGVYRFSFDLVGECFASRHLAPRDAQVVLRRFDPGERGDAFREIFAACLMHAFHLNTPYLSSYIEELLRRSTQADAGAARFPRNVIEPLCPTDPDRALELAEALASSQPQLAPELFKVLKSVASWPSHRLRVLSLVTRVGESNPGVLRGEVRELVEAAASPAPERYDALEGLAETLDVFSRWLRGSHHALQGLAIVALEAMMRLEHQDHRMHPSQRHTLTIRTWRFTLEDPTYRAFYSQARSLFASPTDEVLAQHGAKYAKALRELVRLVALDQRANPSATMTAEALAWFGVVRSLAPRLGVLHIEALRDQPSWVARFGDPGLRPAALDLLDFVEALPGAALARLFLDPPTLFDVGDAEALDRETAYERRRERMERQTSDLARRVAATEEVAQVVALLEKANRLRASEDRDDHKFFHRVQTALEAVCREDRAYGLALFRALRASPPFAETALQVLRALDGEDAEVALAEVNRALERNDVPALMTVAGFVAQSRVSRPELRQCFERLLRHDRSEVRAAALRAFWRDPATESEAEAEGWIRLALDAIKPDEGLARAAATALEALYGYDRDVPAEFARAVLERFMDVPLESLGLHAEGLSSLTRALARTDPVWLLNHLEARAVQPDRALELVPRWGLNEIFSVPPDESRALSACLDRLWDWYADEGSVLSRAALAVYSAFSLVAEEALIEDAGRRIEAAHDFTALMAALHFAQALPDTERRTGLIERALFKGRELHLVVEHEERLEHQVVSGFRIWSKSGEAGLPFPEDLGLRDRAIHGEALAQQKIDAGQPEYRAVRDVWRKLRLIAQRDIDRALEDNK